MQLFYKDNEVTSIAHCGKVTVNQTGANRDETIAKTILTMNKIYNTKIYQINPRIN
ncbi:hypothetical protein [Metabacillus sp. RGM 3146]|uniref:hypothetical protein n=1 Tax=Metabacillus sp. RGM 3146 TaxID=3401092 RepID=UPI003B9AF5E4